MTDIDISAVICTFDRPALLREAVASLATQTLDKSRYEIVVVDNGTNAATVDAVQSLQAAIANLVYVKEPVLGLSRARNTGRARAAGRYVAYLDDDATADPGWLDALIDRFHRGAAPGVGGPIRLRWEREPVQWLPRKYWNALGEIDFGSEARELRSPDHPLGGNMAFEQTALDAIGGFPVTLGRVGDQLLSNEEVAVFWLMDRAGFHVAYEPRAAVSHFVPAAKMTDESMVRNWQGHAVSDAIFQAEVQRRSAGYLAYRLARSIAGLLLIDVPARLSARGSIRQLEAGLFRAYRAAYVGALVSVLRARFRGRPDGRQTDPPA